MMETLIGLGLKSLLIAGITLGLLQLTRRRSAADRSWIAHLGLVALVALPLASLALPALSVEVPAAFHVTAPAPAPLPATIAPELVDPPSTITAPAADEAPALDWTPIAYAIPMAALLLVTLVALLRLFGLRGRAQVLVDPVWLSALAHAQRRMGFKNGTALLTSSELTSPISWGLMRPVILLNEEALGAADEAEAIIAHELAHVARRDWAKLMLARVATAVFWFNPLAWALAREAHQLREEAADDAVLASDIADTDYAQLLVGVARHQGRGLLLGAHGISPGRNSLRRRVSRVLDAGVARGAGGRSCIAGFAGGMLVMSAPLAALTFSAAPPEAPEPPPAPHAPVAPGSPVAHRASVASRAPFAPDAPVSLAPVAAPLPPLPPVAPSPAEISTTVRTAVSTSLTAAADSLRQLPDVDRAARDATRAARDADREARQAERALRGSDRARLASIADERRLLGVTPDYVAAIRAAAPQFRNLSERQLIELRVQRVTPQFVRDLSAAGYGDESVAAIGEAALLGLSPAAIRDYASVGPRRPLADLIELRMMGVTPGYIASVQRGGRRPLTKQQLIELRLTGMRAPTPPPTP